MQVISETNFENFEPWSGAVSTWERIEEEGLINQLEFLLEDLYPEGITDTQLNDILWFEEEWLFDMLGIKDNEEEEEE